MQPAHNRSILGSSPSRPTIKGDEMLKNFMMYLWTISIAMPLNITILIGSSVLMWVMAILCLQDWWTKILTTKIGKWDYTPVKK